MISTHISQKEAIDLISEGRPDGKRYSRIAFLKLAELYDFKVYAGLRGDEYCKQDIEKKWNQTKDQLIRKMKAA